MVVFDGVNTLLVALWTSCAFVLDVMKLAGLESKGMRGTTTYPARSEFSVGKIFLRRAWYSLPFTRLCNTSAIFLIHLNPNCRYMFSDGKSITNFLVNRMGRQGEWAWDNAMELVAWHTLVGMHSPVLVALSSCRRCDENQMFDMYLTIVVVQLVAGMLTEIASIFFAIMGGETVSIVSAWFGLYSLIMSTILAWYRGNLVRKYGPDASVASPGVKYGSCRSFEPLFETLCNLIPAALFGTGTAMVLFAGRFFSTAGTASSEAWVLIVPGALLAWYGFLSGVFLVRHYNQTSHAGRIYPNDSLGAC